MKKEAYFKLMGLNKKAQETPVAVPTAGRYQKQNKEYLNALPNRQITLMGSNRNNAKPLPSIANETLQQAANRQAAENAKAVNRALGDNSIDGLDGMLRQMGAHKRKLSLPDLQDLQKRLNSNDMWKGTINTIIPNFTSILKDVPQRKKYLLRDAFFRQAKNTGMKNNAGVTA